MKKAISILICIFSFVFAENKLMLQISFDEGNIKEMTGNLAGELKGGKFIEGKIGKGIYFDGKEKGEGQIECIIFKDAGKNQFVQNFENGPFTISVWVRIDSSKEYKKTQEILNTAGDIGPGWRLFYSWGMIFFRSGTGKRDPSGKGDYWEVKTNPSVDKIHPDEWNHIAVVRDDNGILSLYLNGKKAAESGKKFEITVSGRPLTIGAYAAGYSYGFKGIIDELKIYKGALTTEEILKEYRINAEKKTKPDGKLNEKIWENAEEFTKFVISSTDKIAPVQTKVLFNHDDSNLYLAFICEEPEIKKIKNSIKENTMRVYFDDCVELMVDADNNKTDYYHFVFNPSGYYGVEFRSQGGHVSVPVKQFNIFTGSNIENDRWTVEIVIPYSSFYLEKIGTEIGLNFARNRRVDLEFRQESSAIEKGQFHNPYSFILMKLPDIDPSLFAIEIFNPSINGIFSTKDKFEVNANMKIKNNSEKNRNLTFSLIDRKEGILENFLVDLKKKEERELPISFAVREQGEHIIEILMKEGNKEICSSFFPIDVKYKVVEIELMKPFYRNSIYASQKLREIHAKISINLKENELKDLDGEIYLSNDKRKNIVSMEIKPQRNFNIMMQIPQLEEGTYFLTFVAKKQNVVIAEEQTVIYKLPEAKGNEVYIDENLNLILNGKPFLPLVWWAGSPFEEIAKTGADGIVIGFGQGAKDHLDELFKLKQYGVVVPFGGNEQKKYFSGDFLSQEAKDAIVERINSIKNHPALLFYYLVDEPEGKGPGPKLLKQIYQLIKEIDPYHPVSITNDTISGIYTYIDCADMFFPDPYVFPLENGKLSKPMSIISEFINAIKDAGKMRKFIGITPQVFDYGKIFANMPPYTSRNNRAPSFVEERCMNYLSIIDGVKGFNYYVYGKRDPKNWGAVNYPDLIIGMPYLVKEKKSLSGVILEGEVSDGTIVSNKSIKIKAKKYENYYYIFACNITDEKVDADFILSFQTEILKVISENRNILVNNKKFSDIFEPYDVHIYTTNLNFHDVISLENAKKEIIQNGGYYRFKRQ